MFHFVGTEHQATDALSHLKTTFEDIKPLQNNLPVVATSRNTIRETKMPLEDHKMALNEVVGDSDHLKEGAAPTSTEFLQH